MNQDNDVDTQQRFAPRPTTATYGILLGILVLAVFFAVVFYDRTQVDVSNNTKVIATAIAGISVNVHVPTPAPITPGTKVLRAGPLYWAVTTSNVGLPSFSNSVPQGNEHFVITSSLSEGYLWVAIQASNSPTCELKLVDSQFSSLQDFHQYATHATISSVDYRVLVSRTKLLPLVINNARWELHVCG